jgi:hypothetical protein
MSEEWRPQQMVRVRRMFERLRQVFAPDGQFMERVRRDTLLYDKDEAQVRAVLRAGASMALERGFDEQAYTATRELVIRSPRQRSWRVVVAVIQWLENWLERDQGGSPADVVPAV